MLARRGPQSVGILHLAFMKIQARTWGKRKEAQLLCKVKKGHCLTDSETYDGKMKWELKEKRPYSF